MWNATAEAGAAGTSCHNVDLGVVTPAQASLFRDSGESGGSGGSGAEAEEDEESPLELDQGRCL